MWGKVAIGLCMATAVILFTQSAMAGTRVYLNFGFPAIDLEYRAFHGSGYVVGGIRPYPPPERVYVVHEYMPYPHRIWVAGCRHWDGYRQVWVPGHWETVYPHRDTAPEYRDRRDYPDNRDNWRNNDRDRWEDGD